MKKIILVFSLALICSISAAAQEMGGVKGKIRNLQGGVLSEVRVTAQQDGQDIKSTSTNKNGEFVLDRLKAGKYSFTFTKRGFTTGTINNVEIGKNKIRDLGSKLALDIDEGTLVIIKGTVFDRNGYSIYGAVVDIAQIRADGSVKKLKTLQSSESGEFSFRFTEGVATYRVIASAKGKSVSKDVTVDSAAIYRLALTLDIGQQKEDQ